MDLEYVDQVFVVANIKFYKYGIETHKIDLFWLLLAREPRGFFSENLHDSWAYFWLQTDFSMGKRETKHVCNF
jgi:hypothetical protein